MDAANITWGFVVGTTWFAAVKLLIYWSMNEGSMRAFWMGIALCIMAILAALSWYSTVKGRRSDR